MKNNYHLIISCPDRRGIVAAVSGFIAKHQGLVLEADHHSDLARKRFFMRYEIEADGFPLTVEQFNAQFEKIALEFEMTYRLTHSLEKQNVLLLVSRASHCLEEILYRWHNREINCNLVGVFSNHADLADRVHYFKLPFYHVSVDDKEAHFKELARLISELKVNTTVLARYMQILPQSLCHKLAGKIINIHHSFLPSFVGAKPYQQAYQRGVKLIGATAHYVTDELDQGPIIEQNVIRVDHRKNSEDFIRLGKYVERSVLADALQAHLEDRVIIDGNKTIVFN